MKYKLLKLDLWFFLMNSLIIDSSDWLIKMWNIFTSLLNSVNCCTIIKICSFSVAVYVNHDFWSSNIHSFQSWIYITWKNWSQSVTRCISLMTINLTWLWKVELIRILWNFFLTKSSDNKRMWVYTFLWILTNIVTNIISWETKTDCVFSRSSILTVYFILIIFNDRMISTTESCRRQDIICIIIFFLKEIFTTSIISLCWKINHCSTLSCSFCS